MEDRTDMGVGEKGLQDGLVMVFPKEICFKSRSEGISDSAVRRDRGGPFQILGPEKEERRPNVFGPIRGTDRNPRWAERTDL